MRITKAESKHLALDVNTITNTHQFLFDGKHLVATSHHIRNQCAVQTVHRAVAGLVCRTRQSNFISLYLDFDVGIHFLGHLAVRAFNLNHVVLCNLNGYAGGKVYR